MYQRLKQINLPNLTLFLFLLLLNWSSNGWSQVQPARKQFNFEKEIKAFENADKTNRPPAGGVLFIGSSSIRLWKSLASDFPEHAVINRGFGGSEIADSVRYFDRIVLPYKPRQIIVYAGGNDVNSGKSPEIVAADFKAFMEKVNATLPESHLAYISIAPNPARWGQIEKTRETNRLISEMLNGKQNRAFIDISSRMLGPDEKPRKELFVADRLHMNERGYAIWREVVGPYLKPKSR